MQNLNPNHNIGNLANLDREDVLSFVADIKTSMPQILALIPDPTLTPQERQDILRMAINQSLTLKTLQEQIAL